MRTKAAEAEAFLERADWHVGIWEVRDAVHVVDLTIRPDGHYIAKEDTAVPVGNRARPLHARGRADSPLCRSSGRASTPAATANSARWSGRATLDYYDGQLQFIDLDALSQSVTIARKRPGSDTAVIERSVRAHAEREREGWYIGIWEVNDPAGWMEFTFRPDGRYIAKSGSRRRAGPGGAGALPGAAGEA